MSMTPNLRKFALTAHVTSSVGLLGSIAAFLALAIAGLNSQDTQIIRAAYLSMDLVAKFIIVPLAFASLLTGLIQSLGTPWGLFRHYWVLAKLFITAFATTILLGRVNTIKRIEDKRKVDEEHEHHVQLIEAREDASEALEATE